MQFQHHYFTQLIIIVLAISGCQSSHKVMTDKPENAKINYRLIYIIHGDANYLYHDEKGNSLQANEQKMAEAKEVARKAKKGEVFIFHQKPERKILWLFPRKDRVFLHYRNGKLIHRERYSPVSSSQALVSESRLFSSHRSEQTAREIFLYFGHKIPEQSRMYHQSRPDAAFNDYIFAEGMNSFLRDKQRFDLTVLSTCDNGTPRIAYRMLGVSRYLLASPQNLHLSHIDSRSLLQLERTPQKSPAALARSLAQTTYNRLSKFIETSVTLSIYDLQSDNFFPLTKAYADYQDPSTGSVSQENVDCAQLPFWDSEYALEDTTVFFKPAAFGRQATQQSHSGWGCQR